MDRKKTILIGALVNAGLLVLLFIMALHQEDAPVKSSDLQQLSHEGGPLFPEFHTLQEQHSQLVSAEENIAALVEAPQMKASEPVHLLPPLAVESVSAPVVLPQVSTPAPLRTLAEVTVKKGDTLEKIARLNHTSVDEMIRLNQLSSSFLRIGQVLKIPAGKGLIAAASKPLAADKLPPEAIQQEYYTVKVGDNPWTIAMKHHLKVDELLHLNDLNEDRARRLKPGDRLRIR